MSSHPHLSNASGQDTSGTVQPTISIVVGCQWGDEGKGKICDILAADSDYVVRFNGGNNAGHTIDVMGEIFKLHLVPSGVLHAGVRNILGAGVVIDPAVLLHELEGLTARGVSANVGISQRAHVIMPYHLLVDEALSKHQAQLAAGSTQRGIGPVCADKHYRHGIRVSDLMEPEVLREKLEKALFFNSRLLSGVFESQQHFDEGELLRTALAFGARLAPYVKDVEVELHHAYSAGKRILFESAQGMSLDPDHGLYPHTSSSNNIAGYASVGSGLGYNCKARVIGVVKGYLSRVGISPVPTEIDTEMADRIRERGIEFGTTTGRARRIGWCDLVQLRQAVRTSGITELAVTKLDVLGGLREIGLCASYTVEGIETSEMPASLLAMRSARPLLRWFPGWNAFTAADVAVYVEKGYASLPEEMRRYIEFLEEAAGCPISIVSLGPRRDQTIIR